MPKPSRYNPAAHINAAMHNAREAAQRLNHGHLICGNAIARTNTFTHQHVELLDHARRERVEADFRRAAMDAERHRQAARAARSPIAFDALGSVAGAVLAALSRPESLRPLIAGTALVTLFCIYLQL